MEEVNNILRILIETKEAIKNNDTFNLKQLSNQTNNTASRTHDPDNIAVAVIIYSLGKVFETGFYKNSNQWSKFYKNVLMYLDEGILALKQKDETKFQKSMASIRKEINNLSGKFKAYLHDVLRKAQINRALRIYEHGISMERTAKLLGVTLFELANYIGSRNPDDAEKTINIRSRIKFVEGIFDEN